MNKPLTVKQEAIFSYIKSSIRDSGFPPTVREIGDHFHITVKGAYDHLKAIEKKGYIRCTQNKSRAIELLVNRDDRRLYRKKRLDRDDFAERAHTKCIGRNGTSQWETGSCYFPG